MLQQLQHAKHVGVFSNYARDAEMREFKDLNVIYGWNYSGKTTLSRLFGLLESKAAPVDFEGCKFAFSTSAGPITEQTYGTNALLVRVFNVDFVQENLSWIGDPFSPILLVGKESIDIERAIEKASQLRKRCVEGEARKSRRLSEFEKSKSKSLTDGAAAIKTALSLVKAFTSAHLESVLTSIDILEIQPELAPDDYDSDLKLAHMPDSERLSEISPVSVYLNLDELRYQAAGLLSLKPAMSHVIDYLKENHAISNWIEQGLPLHEHKANCEFCGNHLAAERMAQLQAHFSQELITHKAALHNLLTRVRESKLTHVPQRPADFFNQFRKRVIELDALLKPQIAAYNAAMDVIAERLESKIEAPFTNPQALDTSASVEPPLRSYFKDLNDLIGLHNIVSINFLGAKNSAIERLKKHHAYRFALESKLQAKVERITLITKHQAWFQRRVNDLDVHINALRAQINLAQRGREAINGLIERLLGNDGIQIEVTSVDGRDRFQLTRKSGKKATHLSEGEKTAVALAFFLTKLDEIKLEDAIVYIDDPISSLDSNHVYQVASLLQSKFIKQDVAGGEWRTACKQLFISTHNFDFFALLRKLKQSKAKRSHYMVKRMTPASSTFIDLPASIEKYPSEYHYLFNVIYSFHVAAKKDDVEVLLSLPNALRRFFELYTYSKFPGSTERDSTIDSRVARIWGDKANGMLKLFHHFSHAENVERMAANNDMICNIESGVSEFMELLKADVLHYEALHASLPTP